MAQRAIIGIAGPSLTADERALFADRPPLGVILFKRNIETRAQLSDLVSAIRDVVPAALMMVDQEGGRVARLRPPEWRAHPPAAVFGALHERDPEAAMRGSYLTGALIGHDCAASGFTVICAPVLDLAVAGASTVVGDRAFSAVPAVVAALAGAVAEGLLAAGVQPVGKHVPGHGRALVDSHLALPELDDLAPSDLQPFRDLAWLPWLMTAHIRYRAVDPLLPATLSRTVLQQVVREAIGFGNVLVSDDLSMHAVSGNPGQLALACLEAGCDVALHCSGQLAETRSVLEAVGEPDVAAAARLQAAASLAMARRVRFDADAFAAERAALLEQHRLLE